MVRYNLLVMRIIFLSINMFTMNNLTDFLRYETPDGCIGQDVLNGFRVELERTLALVELLERLERRLAHVGDRYRFNSRRAQLLYCAAGRIKGALLKRMPSASRVREAA